MKKATKILSVLMALVLTAGMLFVYPLSAGAETVQTRTVMLYLIGSNLESGDGSATWNLVQSMEAEYDENLNFIVMTGGTNVWHTEAEYLNGAEEIDPEYNQIWKLEGRRGDEEHGKMTLLEPVGIEGYEKTLMSDPAVLTAFVDYCCTNYAADQYDIILWNHGGGPAYGFGYDERSETKIIMSLSQIVKAFSDTELFKDGKKFEIIDFDACLMSSAEIVAALGDFTDYMVVSPELEPGWGQEYTTWLNAVRDDPMMNGFDLGKVIVDAMMDFYTYGRGKGQNATLSVIDVKNFRERLLPYLAQLDELLISEAKNVGSRNNRYNFYDELYSLAQSFAYSYGGDSLFDLGNLAGALSVPQSEMNNVTQAQINNAENTYTRIALNILSALGDDDNSGDDVIYARGTEKMEKKVAAGYLRNIDGEVVWAEDGTLTVPITGLSMFFGDDLIKNAKSFVGDIPRTAQAVQSSDAKDYLDRRPAAVAYYSLITKLGETVSELSDKGERYINYRKVKSCMQTNGSSWKTVEKLIDTLVSQGEFDSTDEAEDYLSVIVAQQSREVISDSKVKVKQIEDNDDSSLDYHVTVSNTSAQAFMSLNSSVKVKCKYTDTDEFNAIRETIYGNISFDHLYPDGINVTVSTVEGTLDYADYYNSADDTAAQIWQRLYASSSSVWSVPQVQDTCFVLYDDRGNPHIADIHYLDKSYETAYIPIVIYFPGDTEEPFDFREANLYISKTEEGWQTDGMILSDDEGTERSYTPMDSEWLTGTSFAPAVRLEDAVYLYETSVPISTFSEIDITKDKWGITFGELPIVELDDVLSCDSQYYVEDVYGYHIDITDRFDQADETAKNGDVAYDISLAEATVEPAVYNGKEQKPAVTLTMNGKELVETEDYKVIYLGYIQPGDAYLAVLGLGDYIGTAYIPFTIQNLVLLGDADGDEKVTVLDATCIQKTLASIPVASYQEKAADVDGDTKVTIIDATEIQRWLANIPVPFDIGKEIG